MASGEVSRSGRSIPAENVTSMLSPENSKSIRSPGPYPGSPHIHSWLRSVISCLALTPRAAAASGALIPGLAWKYGTMFSSRTSRVDSWFMPDTACARSRARTSSRSDSGSSTTASAPYPATSRASRSVEPMSIATTSPSRPRNVIFSTTVPARRSAVARPEATQTRACTPVGASPTAFATMSRRSASSGLRTLPTGPIVVTSAPIRDNRKVRTASRSRSLPTRYHRPRSVTTPHGSTVRVLYGSIRDERC